MINLDSSNRTFHQMMKLKVIHIHLHSLTEKKKYCGERKQEQWKPEMSSFPSM